MLVQSIFPQVANSDHCRGRGRGSPCLPACLPACLLCLLCLLAGGGAFAEQTAWPEFHNGVAAGLRLAPGTHQLTRTWVVYNKPPGGACLTCTCTLDELGSASLGLISECSSPTLGAALSARLCRAELHACGHADGPGADRAP